MAALITPGRYTRQPQQPVPIDARWSAKGLRVAYLPNSLNPFDLAGNMHGVDTTTTSTLSLGAPGKVWDFGAGSSTSRILLPSNSIVGTGGVTWLAVIKISSLAAARTIACGNASASGSLQWRISTSGMQELVSSGVSVLSTDTVALTTNTWVAVACTISSQVPVIRSTFARDGRITSNPVTSTVTTTNGVGVLGDRHSASSQPFAGQIAMFACFDTLMSEAELVELTANPWGIFAREPNGPFLFNEDAGAGVTGSLAKTDASDSSAAAGTTTIVSTLAWPASNDTSSASGTTTVIGSLASTEGVDTGDGSGDVGDAISASGSPSNSADTLSAAGTTTIVGTLTKSNTNDVPAGVATTTIKGALAYLNIGDIANAAGFIGDALLTALRSLSISIRNGL